MGLAAGVNMGDSQAPAAESWQGQTDATLLRAEQVRMLSRQQPVAIATNVVIALLVAGVLALEDGWVRLLIWIACTLAVSLARWLLWRKSWRVDPAPPDIEAWARRFETHLQEKVTDATFTFVAIDATGKPRPIPREAT